MRRFSPSFFIGSISIGTVEGSSCVNLGNNLPSGFVSYKKQNQGFGSISGNDNDIHEILSTIEAQDTQDSFHFDGLDDEGNDVLKQIKNEMVNAELEIGEMPGKDEPWENK